MDIAETSGCSNFADDVTRYAWGELPAEARPRIEAHLKECAPCRELVRFVEELTKTVRDDPRRTAIRGEPCPEGSLIVDLEADALDEETARHVLAHVLHCKKCRDAYLLLRTLSAEKFEEQVLREADEKELDRRKLELPELLNRIRELRASLKSLRRLDVKDTALHEVLVAAKQFLFDVERTWTAPLQTTEYAKALHSSLEGIEKEYTRLIVARAPEEQILDLYQTHLNAIQEALILELVERIRRGGGEIALARFLESIVEAKTRKPPVKVE